MNRGKSSLGGGIDIGLDDLLSPKSLKSMKDSASSGSLGSPQKKFTISAAKPAGPPSNLASQLDMLGRTSGQGHSSQPASQPPKPQPASRRQPDLASRPSQGPFAALSLNDQPGSLSHSSSRGSMGQEAAPSATPAPLGHDDPFASVSQTAPAVSHHHHTASASSAVSAASTQPPGDDPFELWGAPPPKPERRSGGAVDATAAADLLAAFAAAEPPQMATSSPTNLTMDETLLAGFSHNTAAHSHQPSSGFEDFAPPPQYQDVAGVADGFGESAIWDSMPSTASASHDVFDAAPPAGAPASRRDENGPFQAAAGVRFEEVTTQQQQKEDPGHMTSQSSADSPRQRAPPLKDAGRENSRTELRDRESSFSAPIEEAPQQRSHHHRDNIFGSAFHAHREDRRTQQGDVREQASRMLGSTSKWLRSTTTRIAKAAKDKLEELDVHSMRPGHGRSPSADASQGSDVPEHYYQWAASLADMEPDQRATVLNSLPEDERLVVQRIMDHQTISSQQRQAVEEASVRVHDMSPGRGRHRRGGSISGDSDDSPTPSSRRASATGDQDGSSRLSRVGRDGDGAAAPVRSRPPPPAYEDIVNAQQPADSPVAAAAAATAAAIEAAKARRRAQAAAAAAQQQQQPKAAAAPPPQPAPTAASAAEQADLLGGHSTAAQQAMPAAPVQQAASPQLATPDDLGDFFGAPAQAAGGPGPAAAADTGDIFSAAPKPAAQPARPQQANGYASAAPQRQQRQRQQQQQQPPRPSANRQPSTGPMLNDKAMEGEPEARRLAREKRLAAQQAQIQAARQEMQMRESAAEQEKSQKVELRDQVKPRMDAWSKGKQDNIRALLSTLHTVLWDNSGWKPPGLTDLVETSKVKRCYMKANLVIHPDKVKQKGGTVEQVVIADIAFDILKVAWGRFEEGELRR